MEIRPVQFTDLPALAELECVATVAVLPQTFPTRDSFPLAQHLRKMEAEFRDPWITFTLAEDDQGLAGWIKYTEDQLRCLVVDERCVGMSLLDELYSEGLRHWRAGEAERVWMWVLAEDRAAQDFYATHGWRATGRTRKSGSAPHPVIAEYLLLPTAG